MGSAIPTPGATPYDQGTGRVDLVRGLAQQIVAEPANVWAAFPWDGQGERVSTKAITYANSAASVFAELYDSTTGALYDLVDHRTAEIPADMGQRARRAELAKVEATFLASGVAAHRTGRLPAQALPAHRRTARAAGGVHAHHLDAPAGAAHGAVVERGVHLDVHVRADDRSVGPFTSLGLNPRRASVWSFSADEQRAVDAAGAVLVALQPVRRQDSTSLRPSRRPDRLSAPVGGGDQA